MQSLLQKAISRIERGWTQHAMARDADGERVRLSDDPKACSWCLCGAIQGDDFKASNALYNLLFDRLPKGFRNLSEWNDEPGRTLDEVLALLRSVVQM